MVDQRRGTMQPDCLVLRIHLILKAEYLPRQARDKHRETQHKTRLLAVLGPEAYLPARALAAAAGTAAADATPRPWSIG